MWNPFLKVEWLKEGRNIRLPMMLIFYNAILAFITILFMFFNAESFQEGYSYDTSAYLYQFLIVSIKKTCFINLPIYSIYRLFLRYFCISVSVFNYKHDSDWNDICTHAFFGMGILFNRQRKTYVRRICNDSRFF